MGRTHALTGWCAGLAVAPLLGVSGVAGASVLALVTAGYALLPDLDHPRSRATRLLGPVTGAASWLLCRASWVTFRLTRRRRDGNGKGTHRHLSHTVAFAAVLGAVTTAACRTWGWPALLAVLVLGLLLSADALGWLPALLAGGTLMPVLLAGGGPAALAGAASWAGVAVALGCVTHDLGDALTHGGCPLLWPISIRRQAWYDLRPPRWLCFTTGGDFETKWLFRALVVAGVLLVPGVGQAAWHLVLRVVALT